MKRSILVFGSVFFGLAVFGAFAQATPADDSYPQPECFNSDICLVSISDCIDPSGKYPSFQYVTKTTVNCITYDGKQVTTASVDTKQGTVDSGTDDASEVANCQLLRSETQQTYPACASK
jgi:hypothetical protein